MSAVAAIGDRITGYFEPIVVLEMRRFLRRFRKRAWVAAVAYVPALVAFELGLLWLTPYGSRHRWFSDPAFVLAFGLIWATARSAGAISGERSRGTFDMLAVTPLKSWQIADQKILAAALPMIACLVVCAPFVAAMAAGDGVRVPSILALFFLASLALISVSSLGVTISCLYKCFALAEALAFGLLASLGGLSLSANAGFLSSVAAVDPMVRRMHIFLLFWLLFCTTGGLLTRLLGRVGAARSRAEKVRAHLPGVLAGAVLTSIIALWPASRAWLIHAAITGLTYAFLFGSLLPAIRWLCGMAPSWEASVIGDPHLVLWGTMAFQVATILIMRRLAASTLTTIRRRAR